MWFLICISLMTKMFLLAICISPFLKYLFNLLPIFNFFQTFLNWIVCIIIFDWWTICIYSLDKILLSEICNTNIFSQPMAYLSFS